MRTVLIAICLTAVSAVTFAQSNQGSISGTIYDRLGRMVQSAPVEVTNVSTGEKYTATTDRTGAWMLSLPSGTYVLSIDVAGWRYTQNSVVIIPEHPLHHDVTLALP